MWRCDLWSCAGSAWCGKACPFSFFFLNALRSIVFLPHGNQHQTQQAPKVIQIDGSPMEIGMDQKDAQEPCHKRDSFNAHDFTVEIPPPDRRFGQHSQYRLKARKKSSGRRALRRVQLQDLPCCRNLNESHAIHPQERWSKMTRYMSFDCEHISLLCFVK